MPPRLIKALLEQILSPLGQERPSPTKVKKTEVKANEVKRVLTPPIWEPFLSPLPFPLPLPFLLNILLYSSALLFVHGHRGIEPPVCICFFTTSCSTIHIRCRVKYASLGLQHGPPNARRI